MPISGVDPTPRPTAVYASNAALPRRPQDSLPSCLLGFGRTRLALASSHQLLLSHPASGFPTGFIPRHWHPDQPRPVVRCGAALRCATPAGAWAFSLVKPHAPEEREGPKPTGADAAN